LSDLRELILRHDERMNELQKNQIEFVIWAKDIIARHDRQFAQNEVRIARLDQEAEKHREEFKEFMEWARNSKDETRKEFDEKIANLQAIMLEAQMRSDVRMTRIEKNLENLARSGRNGENGRE
jgi:hypothetical protein